MMKKNIYSLFLGIFVTIGGFAQNIPSYYNSIDFELSGVALKNALAQLVTNTHTNDLSYGQAWTALKYTDKDPDNQNNVILIYGWPNVTSGTNARTRNKNNHHGGGNGVWNREHVYAKSLGVPNLGTSGPGSDAHHLRPADVQKNSARGNHKFTAGSGNSGLSNGEWYPGDEWKGDVARMMMYMYLRYGTRCLPTKVGVGSAQNTPDDMIDLFLQWNAEDPVSEIEIQRNEVLSGNNWYAQGNRNPFIDNPFLATKIWGGPLAQDTWGLLSNESFNTIEFGMYPNPTYNRNVFISSEEFIDAITIFSADGKMIRHIQNPMFFNNEFEIKDLNSGFYLIQISADNRKSTKKLIVK